MAGVRTRMLVLRGSLAGATTHTLYTCPPNRTAIVKDFSVHHLTGTDGVVSVFVQRGTEACPILRDIAFTVGKVLVSSGRDVVLHPGDQLLSAGPPANSIYRITVSGALLFGAPAD